MTNFSTPTRFPRREVQALRTAKRSTFQAAGETLHIWPYDCPHSRENTTNAIESINARIRRAVNARSHFPTEQAALKCIYLAIMSLDPTGKGRRRWSNRWKAALNAFQITFDGRMSASRN